MGNFNLPRFQYIINTDAQAQLYGDDGTGPASYYSGFLTPSATADKFSLVGELDWLNTSQLVLLNSATRIINENGTNGAKQILDCQVGGTVDASNIVEKGHVFRVVTSMPSLEDTAYQNIPLEKRYQIPSNCTTVDEVAVAIVNTINADSAALVTATIGGGTGDFTITDKDPKQVSNIYVGLAPDGSDAIWSIGTSIGTAAAAPVNVYEDLKNIQWSNSVDFDRNAEYYPEKGAVYTSYYFKIQGQEVASGGHTLPSQVPGTFETEYVVYVKQGLTLHSAMNDFVTDMNV